MKTSYSLLNRHLKGKIEVDFMDGILSAFRIEIEPPLTLEQFNLFRDCLPHSEADINNFETLRLRVEQIDLYGRMTAPQKIALFCQFYKEYHYKKQLELGIPLEEKTYKATRIDGQKIKEYKVTPEILSAYFSSKLFEIRGPEGSPGKYSMRNFMDYYNPLLREMEMVVKEKSEFPDHYSKKVEDSLSAPDQIKYWAHLRSLGFHAVKKTVGTVTTTEWVKN